MKNKPTLIGKILIIAALIVFIVWRYNAERNIEQGGIILNALTIEWVGYKTRGLKYNFYYQGKLKTGSNSSDQTYGQPNFLNRTFPVIYDSKSGISRILITPADFEKYDIAFPDSLNWVLPYLKNN